MLRRQTYTATISSDARRTGAESTAITLTSVVEIRLCRAFSRYSRLAIRTRSCLLYPRERTCAAQLEMSAVGHSQAHGNGNFQDEARARLSRQDVCFGSKADICGAPAHVRFTPESGHRHRTCQASLMPDSRTIAPHLACSLPSIASISSTSGRRRRHVGSGVRSLAFSLCYRSRRTAEVENA